MNHQVPNPCITRCPSLAPRGVPAGNRHRCGSRLVQHALIKARLKGFGFAHRRHIHRSCVVFNSQRISLFSPHDMGFKALGRAVAPAATGMKPFLQSARSNCKNASMQADEKESTDQRKHISFSLMPISRKQKVNRPPHCTPRNHSSSIQHDQCLMLGF